MKKFTLGVVVLALLAVYLSYPSSHEEQLAAPVATTTPVVRALTVTPRAPIQGESVRISIEGTKSAEEVETLAFNGQKLPVFMENGQATALVGLDLRQEPGTYPLRATFVDGSTQTLEVNVGVRKIDTAPLGIPETLGGNTPESEKELINTLVEEGKIISAIPVTDTKLWSKPFAYPLAAPVITDVYGYSRETGASTLAHKGTDFRAKVGTKVSAINAGVVAYTGFLRNYGNVIAVDHGARVLSIYMHLSKISVVVGQHVERGELVGLSGDTGYVLGAHLHLTIRIGGISIDPMAFFKLMGPNTAVAEAKTVVAFGDSLTVGVGSESGGYVARVSESLKTPIMNFGVSGNTTADALKRLPAVLAEKPDVTIVLLGGNDFLRGVPPEETFQNLTLIIDGLKKAGSKVLLLGLASNVAGNRDREYFDALAKKEGVAYAPDMLRGIYGVPTMMSVDAIHPNDAGYALMAERIASALAPLLR